MSKTIPEGFKRHFRTSSVTAPWKPIYSRRNRNFAVAGYPPIRPIDGDHELWVERTVLAYRVGSARAVVFRIADYTGGSNPKVKTVLCMPVTPEV